MSNKILIVYYSLTGNNKYIAEIVKDALNADILPLKPIKEINPNSGMKYLWGGFQATMRKKPKLEPIDLDPLSYDVIILGTPVWAWTISPPVRTFISQYDLSGKKIAAWICSGGGPGKTLQKIKEIFKDSNFIGEISFVEPLKNTPDESKVKAIEWAKELIKKLN